MLKYVKTAIKWLLIAVLMGVIGGIIGAVFHKCLELVTHTREENSWLIYLLPLAGLLIAAMYHPFRKNGSLSTNRILASAEADEDVPFILTPLIFVSTLITHLFGGSAGREGAALQLGGSIGYNIGKLMKLDNADLHTIVMAGMSSFFSAMFGAPITAAIFALEVIRAHHTHRRGFMPCIISSATAYAIARFMGTEGVHYTVAVGDISAGIVIRAILLAVLCAVVSIAFCLAIRYCGLGMKKLIANEYIRTVAGSVIIIALMLVLGTTDYNGAGMHMIDRAMSGESEYYDFALKIIFTAVTIAAGFKGGEIVPTLFIGATFGCVAGRLLGLDPAFAASLGFAALFCGVVKCPLASVALALEVFGGEGLLIYALVCAVTFALSGKFGIYKHKALFFQHKDVEKERV